MSEPQEPHGPMRLVVDFGPLVVFFATYKLTGGGLHGTLVATEAFMAAVLIAIVGALAGGGYVASKKLSAAGEPDQPTSLPKAGV